MEQNLQTQKRIKNSFGQSIGKFRRNILKISIILMAVYLLLSFSSNYDYFYKYFYLVFFIYAGCELLFLFAQIFFKKIYSEDIFYRLGYFFMIVAFPFISFFLLSVLVSFMSH